MLNKYEVVENIVKIYLDETEYVTISKEDFELVDSTCKHRILKVNKSGNFDIKYTSNQTGKNTIKVLRRLIVPNGKYVFHKDGNKLNHQRDNLMVSDSLAGITRRVPKSRPKIKNKFEILETHSVIKVKYKRNL